MARGRKQTRIQNEDGTVTCSVCGFDKEIEEFYKDESRPLGIQWYCKKCNAEKAKERWEKKQKECKITIGYYTGCHISKEMVIRDLPEIKPYGYPKDQKDDIGDSFECEGLGGLIKKGYVYEYNILDGDKVLSNQKFNEVFEELRKYANDKATGENIRGEEE